MPKINVYLPDDLADAVRDTGVPVSAICQRALEQAVRRITAIRQISLTDLSDGDLAGQLSAFTARAVTVLRLARDSATSAVTTTDLLNGILTEGNNLALQVLRSMEIDPERLRLDASAEPGEHSFSDPATNALELTVGEATGLGHNYVGCEHLLIGLAAEPDGAAGRALRAAGADVKAVRRAVSAALAGYKHLREQTSPGGVDTLRSAIRQALAPLIRRIEALESR
jgi:ATP-dependent Clp protease ATP-binding subunit ClpA